MNYKCVLRYTHSSVSTFPERGNTFKKKKSSAMLRSAGPSFQENLTCKKIITSTKYCFHCKLILSDLFYIITIGAFLISLQK